MKKHGDQTACVQVLPASFRGRLAAAAASMAAQKQGKVLEFRHAVASTTTNSPETFEKIAKDVGIKNIEQFKKDMVLIPRNRAASTRTSSSSVKIGVQGNPEFSS